MTFFLISPFPRGVECYAVDVAPVRARGVRFADVDLPDSLGEQVRDVLRDAEAEEEVKRYLESFDGTGFKRSDVESVLFDSDVIAAAEDWRVGEAIAQAELEANRGCSFPWSARRDAKNRRASPAGAEMVGFVRYPDGAARFAFGEVKTSSEKNAPPGVAWDLRRQLKELRDDPNVAKALVEYLAFRAKNAPWERDFIEAFTAWLPNPGTFAIYGVLVRDADANEADLRAMAKALASGTTPPTKLELRALYFDAGLIPGTNQEPPGDSAS